MTQHKLVGFGHSHLSCIQQAYNAGQKTNEFPDLDASFFRLNAKTFQPNFEMLDISQVLEQPKDNKPRQPSLQRAAERLLAQRAHSSLDVVKRVRVLTALLERRIANILKREEPEAILLIAMGNEYNTLSLLRHPEPYDFEFPGSGIAPDQSIAQIPYTMMKAQMQQLAEQNVLLFWRLLNEITDVPVFMLPPPPPIASELHILSYPGNFAERAETYGLSPVGFRRKMWMLYCQVLREAVAGSPTRFVDLPEIAFVDGCLAKQFWQEDPTHANATYGSIILNHIRTMAFTPEEERA